MGIIDDNIDNIFKLFGILFALGHFLAGFIMYREIIRMNNVIRTKRRGVFVTLANLYILVLIGVLILIIII